MSVRFRISSLARLAGLTGTSLLLIVSLLVPQAARAQGPEAVAAGAAIAGVVIQAVGGLTTWVGQQSNDCYVAGLGAAWGKDCNLSKEECTDTGYSYAYCAATGDNGCAHGFGQGWASEGLLGSWSSCEIKPYASAWTKSLHTTDDAHFARGWGKAGVDGTSRCAEEATPGSAPRTRDGVTPAALSARLTETTIVAHIHVDTLSLSAGSLGGGRASMNLSLKIDGALVWSGSANLDQAGGVSLGGGLTGTPFVRWFDPTTGHWEMRIIGYSSDYVVGTFGGAAATGLLAGATRDVHVEMSGDAGADAENANSGLTTYMAVSTPSLHAVDALGEPVLKGQAVQITTPLTVMCVPELFGSVMTDMQLFDPQTGLSVAVLDFAHYQQLTPGMKCMVRGIVTHHEGRTVLCSTQIQPTGQFGQVLQPMPMPIAALLNSAEQREGSLVAINDAHIIGGDSWPVRNQRAVLQVMDSSGGIIDVELDQDTDIDGSAPPAGQFQLIGFVSQYDPPSDDAAASISSGGTTTQAGGPGYFGGYRIRPRGRADIVGAVAGAPQPIDPVGNGAFQLRQNQPNPFNPVTSIAFNLRQAGGARLRIYSIDGRLVRTLVDGSLAAGEQSAQWDGRDDVGRSLPSGLYLYSLEAGGQRVTRKMLMTK